ncbi:MAG: phosphoglycerate kinase [Elusimicrobiaceae bacterium]|nr:phosphoglycerate kinase [Elusimicrobiaceae bacterium]
MNFDSIKKIQDMDLKDKKVLVRVDYNVPLKDGKVDNNKRIVATEKTIKHLLENNCRVVLVAHLGRPKGKVCPEFSLAPVAAEVEKLFGVPVHFATDCIGEAADKVVAETKNGEIALLENLRFHAEEEKNDPEFAKQLAKHGEIFVQEAFGTVHRAHASTSAVADYLPGCAGYLVQKEVEFLGKTLANPARPFAAVIGGAKVSDKIMLLNNLLDKVNVLIIGGGMAYTFLKAKGMEVGNSLLDESKIEEAKGVMAKAEAKGVKMLMPIDFRISKEFSETAEAVISDTIPADMEGMDIGPKTEKLFADELMNYKTIFWNGPMGVFEFPNFAKGSFAIAQAMIDATKAGAVSIIGGGDSVNVIKKGKFNQAEFSHVSTGGGASMEFVEGKELPGLVALAK